MRALTLIADRKLELAELPPPAAPAVGEVQVAIKAVALNHLDLWGYRGMAFAKRKMPVVVGVEAAGEIAAVGPDAAGFRPGDPVVVYGALTCGTCKACREGRDNLCENVAGIMGFHLDGFARDRVNMPARLVIPVPAGVALRDAACAPIAFATVQHMLFDNAKLEPGESILVHAGGSGVRSGWLHNGKGVRWAARHLRIHIRALDDHQLDAAFPAAVSHYRLVRCLHAQHPREPRQDGERGIARDRHRGRARRFRAWTGAAGKPPSVRKNHRHLLIF